MNSTVERRPAFVPINKIGAESNSSAPTAAHPVRGGRSFATLLWTLTAAVALAGGCSAQPNQQKKPTHPLAKNTRTTIAPAKPVDPMLFDPCAERMHDIAGMLLNFYAKNKRTPARLDELASVAMAGEELSFVCPESGQPYVYVAEGLPASDSDQRLYVYDPLPSHNGLRWGLLSFPQGDLKVVPMDDAYFRKFSAPVPLIPRSLKP